MNEIDAHMFLQYVDAMALDSFEAYEEFKKRTFADDREQAVIELICQLNDQLRFMKMQQQDQQPNNTQGSKL